jgi:hypothetical protein
MSQAPNVVDDPEKPIAPDIMAAAIVEISQGMKRVLGGRLNQDALELLIQHNTRPQKIDRATHRGRAPRLADRRQVSREAIEEAALKNLQDQIASARREIAMRERVYPAWIRKGSMKEHVAAHELECMRQILDTLLRIEAGELVPLDPKPKPATEEIFTPGVPEIRRSERLRVLEVLSRHVPTGAFLRASAAVKREIGE